MARFRLKKNARLTGAKWLNRETVYEGKLISMTERVVRLFPPIPSEQRPPHLDVSYDWLIPVR